MRSAVWWAWVVALAGSCAPTAQDRAQGLTRDGLHLYKQGAFSDARETFRAALAAQPEDPELHFHLARCSDRMGQGDLAEKGYRDCLQRDADHAEGRFALAALLVKRDRRGEARRMAEDWLRARPTLAGPYALDGWLRAETGDLISARSRLQEALTRDPLDVRALVELGRVFERLGYPDRALVLYQRSLAVRPDQPEVTRRVEHLLKVGTPAPRPE